MLRKHIHDRSRKMRSEIVPHARPTKDLVPIPFVGREQLAGLQLVDLRHVPGLY
jgi:hypothetical protein